MTGGGAYCTGGDGAYVGVAGSETGTQYQLFRGTTSLGIPAIGTGECDYVRPGSCSGLLYGGSNRHSNDVHR